MKRHFHPKVDATHTDSIIDKENSGGHVHDIRYKRVPICFACSIERGRDNCSRVEPIVEKQETA